MLGDHQRWWPAQADAYEWWEDDHQRQLRFRRYHYSSLGYAYTAGTGDRLRRMMLFKIVAYFSFEIDFALTVQCSVQVRLKARGVSER